MPGIIGTLCTNERDLRSAAAKRRKAYVEESVPHNQVETYKQKEWEIARRLRTKTRMRKKKTLDELFEDHVWLIFYRLGFSCMNKDRNLKLKFDAYEKQIDVLARDTDNVFVVECTSSQSNETINAKVKLEELVGKQDDIRKALQEQWGRRCGRMNLVVTISSPTKREADERYVAGKKNLFLWSKRDIAYIERLVGQAGSAAKYQLYSVIFAGKRQRALRKEFLALRGKVGGRVFYSFLISAKQLLRYSYVHHRGLTSIVDASQAYQRMLRSTKLKEIARFIDEKQGYFPNSVILNFSPPLQWNQKQATDSVALGTIILPGYYGCAWVIDGQHRLYGAASAKADVILPVLAFEGLQDREQAELFVEINEKQKKVEQNLLWDLYSDIYRGSSDEKQKLLYQVAETAKRLEDSGPLKGYIEIPSIPASRPVKLSLTTVCSTIHKYSPWKYIRHPSDESKIPETAARFIRSFFQILKSAWPEDWAKGRQGVVLSNNGFGVLMMVFADIVKHIAYIDDSVLQPHKAKDFETTLREKYLPPVVEYLKSDDGLQKAIRTQGGRGPQGYNAALLDLKIKDFIPEFSPARLGEDPQVPASAEPQALPNIEQKARNAEPVLRSFVLDGLKQQYGTDKWWRIGVPGGPKGRADKKWGEEILRKPYLRERANQNETKFHFLGLGDMIEVIICRENWESIFENVFGDKTKLDRRIRDIIALRNPATHTRRIDDQDVADGKSGLLWLSSCIGDQSLNPFL